MEDKHEKFMDGFLVGFAIGGVAGILILHLVINGVL